MVRKQMAALLLVLGLFSVVTACSDNTKEKASDAAQSAGEDVKTQASKVKDNAAAAVDYTAARAAAEALRASLKGNDTADKKGIRSVDAIDQAGSDLPGDPDITGVDDGNGDGLDDDGKVQVAVDDAKVCVTLPAEGENTTVADGAC